MADPLKQKCPEDFVPNPDIQYGRDMQANSKSAYYIYSKENPLLKAGGIKSVEAKISAHCEPKRLWKEEAITHHSCSVTLHYEGQKPESVAGYFLLEGYKAVIHKTYGQNDHFALEISPREPSRNPHDDIELILGKAEHIAANLAPKKPQLKKTVTYASDPHPRKHGHDMEPEGYKDQTKPAIIQRT